MVLLGDDIMPNKVPLTKQLMNIYEKYEKSVVATVRIPEEKTNRFGVIDLGEQQEENLYQVNHLIEKPQPEEAPSNLGIIGRYLLTAEIFDILQQQQPDAGNEIQLTDALETLNETDPIFAYEYTGLRYDVGDKFGMLIANIEYGLQHEDTAEKMKQHITEVAKELRK